MLIIEAFMLSRALLLYFISFATGSANSDCNSKQRYTERIREGPLTLWFLCNAVLIS